jgi:hypothetical protein
MDQSGDRRRRVPQDAHFREAVEDLIKKYEEPRPKEKSD